MSDGEILLHTTDSDWPAYTRSLLSAFVIRSRERIKA